MSAGAPQDRELFDPGLQLERTHLSWSRTALGFVANAALMARASQKMHPHIVGWLVAGGLLLVGVAALVHGRRSYGRRASALIAGAGPMQPHVLRRMAAATAVLAVLAALGALSTLLAG